MDAMHNRTFAPHSRVTTLAAILVLYALSAAACPTADDAEVGIEITYPDGVRSIITREASGAVRETEYWDGETAYVYFSANGLIETGYLDPETNTTDSISYTFDTSDLLPVRPWLTRSGEQIVTNADGVAIDRVPFTLRTRNETIATIGDCTFRAIPLETYYYSPGEPSMVEYIYLLDLGIPVSVGHAYLVGGFASGEANIPIAIRATPDASARP